MRAEMVILGDGLVGIAPGDLGQHLLLPGRQLVQIGSAEGPRSGGEGVEHEGGQAPGEHHVAVGDPADCEGAGIATRWTSRALLILVGVTGLVAGRRSTKR